MKKQNFTQKIKRYALTTAPAIIVLSLAVLIVKSLQHCNDALCKCEVEDHIIQNYLFVQGFLLVVYVIIRIVDYWREQAVHFTPEVRLLGYFFALLPLFIRLSRDFSKIVIEQTLFEIPIVLGIELLIVILLRIYDKTPNHPKDMN